MVLIQPLARYFLCPTQKSEITVNTTNNCPVILKVWINRSGPSSPLYLKMNSWKKKRRRIVLLHFYSLQTPLLCQVSEPALNWALHFLHTPVLSSKCEATGEGKECNCFTDVQGGSCQGPFTSLMWWKKSARAGTATRCFGDRPCGEATPHLSFEKFCSFQPTGSIFCHIMEKFTGCWAPHGFCGYKNLLILDFYIW